MATEHYGDRRDQCDDGRAVQCTTLNSLCPVPPVDHPTQRCALAPLEEGAFDRMDAALIGEHLSAVT